MDVVLQFNEYIFEVNIKYFAESQIYIQIDQAISTNLQQQQMKNRNSRIKGQVKTQQSSEMIDEDDQDYQFSASIEYPFQELPLKLGYQDPIVQKYMLKKIKRKMETIKYSERNTLESFLLTSIYEMFKSNQSIEISIIEEKLVEHNRINTQGLQNIIQQQKEDNSDLRIYDPFVVQNIFQHIMPINCYQLRDKSSRFTQIPNSVAIFVLGMPGAGKTSMIRGQLGYEMAPIKVKGIPSLSLRGKLQKHHESLKTNQTGMPETQDLGTYDLKMPGTKKQKYYIIDTPGNFTEINNKLLILDAQKHCQRSLFFIIHQLQLLKTPQGIFDLAKDIAQFFTFSTVQDLSSFLILILNPKGEKITQKDVLSSLLKFPIDSNKRSQKQQVAATFIFQSLKDERNQFKHEIPFFTSTNNRVALLEPTKKKKIQVSQANKKKIKYCGQQFQQNIFYYVDKAQIEKIAFYFDQLRTLHTMFPEILESKKNRVEKKLKTVSKNCIDKFFNVLNSKIEERMITPKQLDRLEDKSQILQKFNELAAIDKNISCQQDLKTKMGDLQNILVDLVHGLCKESQIHNIVNLINALNNQFGSYIPNLMNSIEGKCRKEIENYHIRITQSKKTQKSGQFDNYFWQYKINYDFYCEFSKTKNSVFLQLNKFRDYRQILRQNKNEYTKVMEDLLAKLNILIQCCQKNIKIDESLVHSLNNANSILMFSQQSEQIKANNVRQLFERIQREFQPISQSLIRKIVTVLEFKQNFEQQIASLDTLKYNLQIICKQILIKSISAVPNISYDRICRVIEGNRAQFRNILSNLIQQTNRKELFSKQKMKEYQILDKMKKKIEIYDIITKEKQNKLLTFYESLKSAVDSNIRSILNAQFSDEMSGNVIQQVYANYESIGLYNRFGDQIADKIQTMNAKFEIKLKQFYRIFRVVSIQIKQIRNSTQFKRFKRFKEKIKFYLEYLLPNDIKNGNIIRCYDEHSSIYISARQIMIKLSTLINNASIEDIISRRQGEKSQDLNPIVSFDEHERVKILKQVYEQLNDIHERHIVFVYIKNQQPKLFDAEGASINVVKRDIVKIIQQKVKQIKQSIKSMSISGDKGLISLSDTLKKQCRLWLTFWQEANHLYLIDQKAILQIALTEIDQQVAIFSSNLQTGINDLFDNEGIRNKFLLQRYYGDIKYSLENHVGNYQSQFRTLLNYLDSYLRKQISLLVTLKDSSIKELHPNLLPKIQHSIQLYQYFTRFISNQDISRYQIRSLNLLQNSFNRAAQQAKRLKQTGILYTIQSQIYRHELRNAKRNIEIESTDNKFLLGSRYDISEDIKNLYNLLALEQKRIGDVFEDPLNQNNIDMLPTVYNQTSAANKRILRIKILDAFKRLFHIYHTLPYGSASQALASLKFAYYRIPSQIKQCQSIYKQLFTKAEQRNSDLKRDQKENISSSSTSVLVRKYYDYLKSDSTLQYQCCQQLGRRINPIVNQILTKTYPIEIITHTKSDLMSLQQPYKIDSKSELHKVFWTGEDKILIQVSNMQQESVKKIQIVLQREIMPTYFKLEDINMQIKNISDIHQRLITVLPRGKFIVDKITQFLQQIKGQFEKLCPFRKLQELREESNYDLNKFGDLLKICIENVYIYKRLFTQQGEKNDRASEQMIDEDNDFSQILEKVYTFQDNINGQADGMIAKLANITFNQLSHSCYTSLQVRNFLDDCGKTINLLRIYEDSKKQIENVDYMRNELHTSNLIMTLQQKLDEYIVEQLRKIEDAVKIKTNQFPKSYHFFQILLQQINEGHGLFLISGRDDDSMMKNILDNPIKFLRDRIQKHIDQFKSTVVTQRQRLMNFLDNEKPDHQRQLEALHLEHIKVLQNIKQKKIRTQQAEIRKFNYEELSQDSMQQIDDNYTNNTKNAKEQYEKNKKLCIQKFNPSRQDQLIKSYTQSLITIQKMREGLNSQYDSQKQSCKDFIKQQLKILKSKKMIILICKSLEKYDFGGYSINLKKEHDLFRFYFFCKFEEMTKFQDVQYATDRIKLLSGKQIKKQLYKQQCNNVQDKIKSLKVMVKKLFSKKKCMIQEIVRHYKKSQQRLQKIARILSVWSIYKSSDDEDEQQIQYEANAHPVQILALVVLTQKLVGSTDPLKEMQSKLAEVGTGQGKSIVLATLACYFAKQGYQADVACYSQYLSSRDFKDFSFLFEIFGVKDKITYGTFNDICQKIINVEEYKKLTQEWLVNESSSMLSNMLSRPMKFFQGFTQKLKSLFSKTKRIFLCDQCDVFFQKQYFGEVFRPILRFGYPQCTIFIEYVWRKVKENPYTTAEQIISSIEFRTLITEFPILTTVFKNQIQEMIQGARNPINPKHQYIISKNTIKYMNNGSLSNKLHYKFETIFLYLKLRDQKKLQLSQQNIFIPINIAQFMYSCIPKYYSAIIGLSGTVQHLIKGGKMKIIENLYDIVTDYIYILPTIYKDKICIESPHYLQKTSTYYQKVIELTEIQLIKERPVFICFQSHSKLVKLQNDPLFKQFINKNKIVLNFLHQYLDDDEQRDINVKQAVKKGQITLMAQQYLRGTDFVVLDDVVKLNGGVHIILTYITESESLFIQCKGRTARMGESGSVDYVWNTDQLPKQFKLPQNRDSSLIKTAMGQYWEHKDRKMIEEKQVKMERNKLSHNQTMKYVKGEDHELNNFIKFIQGLNYFPMSQKKTIVIGIDATLSMENVFTSLTRNLQLVMQRIDEMMQNNNINGRLKIMIAAYRNYNSGHKVLEVSKFYQNGEPLVNFLRHIKVEKGWGNEAVEVLFQYINDKLNKIDMLILIGDAPPNTPEHVKRKRNPKPSGDDRISNTWPEFVKNNPTVYPQTTFSRELNKFSKQCIVSGLYLKNPDQTLIQPTFAFFNSINSQLNFKGQVKELNKYDLEEGKILTQFLTTNILTAMAGVQNREYFYRVYGGCYT